MTKFLAIAVLVVVATFSFADSASPGVLGSSSNDGVHVIKCASCFYMLDDMPLNMSNYMKLPKNDPRCQKWIDGIPQSQYQTCEAAMDGEATACLFVNLTMLVKNAVSDSLSQGTNIISGGTSSFNNMTSGTGTGMNIPGISTGGGSSKPSIPGISTGGGSSKPSLPGLFGRKKRQSAFSNIPGIGAGSLPTGSALNPGISSIPGISKIQLPSFPGSNSNGTYTYKIWYKGCVKLSLLETLVGSHCRLDPDITDVQVFSQQALLQPLMDVMTTLNSGLNGFSGSQTNVTGLCYIVMKQLAKQLYNKMLHYNFSSSASSAGPGPAMLFG